MTNSLSVDQQMMSREKSECDQPSVTDNYRELVDEITGCKLPS